MPLPSLISHRTLETLGPRSLHSLRRIAQVSGGAALAMCLLAGCSEPGAPVYLSSGSNGFVYVTPDYGDVVRDSAQPSAQRVVHRDWVDTETEAIVWASSWGLDKPWCSLVGPSRRVDWKELNAQGIQKPKPSLRCLDLQGQPSVKVELPHAFSHASLDPSGQSVILYSAPNGPSEGSAASNLVRVGSPAKATLFNPKLAAVVELSTGAIRSMVVEGFGAAIETIRFPEYPNEATSIEVDGKARRLAVFIAKDEMVLVDLNDPQLSQVAVTTRVGLNREPLIRAIPKQPGLDDPLLVVAGESWDLDQLRLRSRKDRPEALDVDYSILSTRFRAWDLQAVNLDGTPWLLAASTSGMSMVNLKSSEERLLPDFGSIKQIRTYKDAQGNQQALAWASGQSTIYTIDTHQALTSLGRRPKAYKLGEGLRNVVWVGERKVAAVGNSSITVIDLETEKQTPLAGIESDGRVLYPGGDYIYLLVSDYSSNRRASALARVNMNTMVPETQTLEGRLAGAGAMAAINGGETILIRQYHPERDEFGVGVFATASADLTKYQYEFFNNEAK